MALWDWHLDLLIGGAPVECWLAMFLLLETNGLEKWNALFIEFALAYKESLTASWYQTLGGPNLLRSSISIKTTDIFPNITKLQKPKIANDFTWKPWYVFRSTIYTKQRISIYLLLFVTLLFIWLLHCLFFFFWLSHLVVSSNGQLF